MKTYVLIARHLGKVSGEKIYSYNKIRYMLSLDWRVLFLSGKTEITPFETGSNYAHYVFPALTYAPECYTKREVRKTVEGIANIIGDTGSDECIIESDSVNRAAWGELIARRVGAKHVAFLLQETHPYDEETRKFLRFKYDRHELAGVVVESINQILGDDSVERRPDTKIAAFCLNSVEDCEDTFSSRLPKEAALTFGSIGRLDKGCIPAILDAFKQYASEHSGEKYNVVMIGGATGKKRIQVIKKLMSECPNIHLLITGYIYPIPLSLIENVDLFVSTAGSATVSYRFHRPTIRVHPTTGEPCGISGLDDLSGKSMYEIMPDTTLKSCIERAIMNTDKISYGQYGFDDYFVRMNAEFARHLQIAGYTKEKAYYDEELLRKIRTTHIKGKKMHRIIGHLIGAKGLNTVLNVMRILGRR